MAKLSSTHIYGDLYVDGTINGALSGNASTATTLQTARTINGTSFNGSANITTTNWGTARTITIGSTGKSVNGSGNVSWSLDEIGAAAKSHGTHLTLGTGSGNAYRGDYGNTAYTHSQAAHAPSNAQKNSDITKAEIEAKLTGNITSHNHYLITGTSGTSWTTASRDIQDDCRFEFSSHITKSATGLFPVDNNANAIISFNRHSGPHASQLGFSSNGKIYYRWGNGTAITDSTAWQQIYTSSNKPTAADIGAAASSHGTHVNYGGNGSATTVSRSDHTHSYLPLGGGTMTGKITTPNNAQGITIGDDVTICDRNIADHLVLEGSTATNGGITFGSGKDTNIYRGGANLLKTDDTMNAVGGFQWNGQSLDNRYAAASHGTHLTIGTGSGNAAAGNHTHNQINSRGAVTCESGVAGRPAVSGLSMSEVYSNGYPTPYGNVISLRGMGDGQILVGWSGTDGAHAPVYVRSKRDNTNTANWSGWAQVYTTANKPAPADIGALPLSGGTMTGSIKAGGLTSTWVDAAKNSNAVISSTASAGTFHPMYTFKTNNGSMVLAGYQGGLQCSYLPKAKVDAGENTVTAHCQIFTENGGAVYQNVVEAYQHKATMSVLSQNTSGGIFACGGTIGLASSDASTFQACFRNASSRAICDIGTSGLKGRLYIRSGEGPAGSGVSLENRVSNGTNYVQWLSPEAGTIALTAHLSDRTKKDNIVYVGSKDSEFTNKDFYDFIKKDLGLATYTIKEEYATTDTHTKLNFIAQDILYDYDNDCINKVGNLIVQTEDAMEQQGTLKFDPDTFASVIAGALKESIDKIEEDNEKIKTLENEVKELEAKNKALEELVYSMNERLLNLEDNI